jgi:hypothetical protein
MTNTIKLEQLIRDEIDKNTKVMVDNISTIHHTESFAAYEYAAGAIQALAWVLTVLKDSDTRPCPNCGAPVTGWEFGCDCDECDTAYPLPEE